MGQLHGEIKSLLSGKKVQKTRIHNFIKRLSGQEQCVSVQNEIEKELENAVDVFSQIFSCSSISLPFFLKKGLVLKERVILLSNVFMHAEKEGFSILLSFKKLFVQNIFQKSSFRKILENMFRVFVRSIDNKEIACIENFSLFMRQMHLRSYQEIVEKLFFERIEACKIVLRKEDKELSLFLEQIFLIKKREKTIAYRILKYKEYRRYVLSLTKTLFVENHKEIFSRMCFLVKSPYDLKKVLVLSRKCGLHSVLLSTLSNYLSQHVALILEQGNVVDKIILFKKDFELKFPVEFPGILKEILETEINKKKVFFSKKLALYWVEKTNESCIADVIALFKCLKGKEVFQEIHTRLLEQKILRSLDIDLQRETNFLEKLEEECGSQYTSVCSEILKDVILSQELFLKYCAGTTMASALHPLVVSSALSAQKKGVLFQKMQHLSTEEFTKFYNKAHPRRKLFWQEDAGSVIVSTLFQHRRIDLVLSQIQARVLFVFSDDSVRRLEEIKKAVLVSPYSIEKELGVLTKAKILLQKEEGFLFNKAFDYSGEVFELVSDKREDVKHNNNTVCLKERRYCIESFIVRRVKREGVVDAFFLIDLLKKEFFEEEKNAMNFLEGLCTKGYLSFENGKVKYIP